MHKCDNCGNVTAKLQCVCGTTYCSQACQRSAWSIHKKDPVCRKLRKKPSSSSPIGGDQPSQLQRKRQSTLVTNRDEDQRSLQGNDSCGNICSYEEISSGYLGMVALRDIRMGELILVEKPILIVPDRVYHSQPLLKDFEARLDRQIYEQVMQLTDFHADARCEKTFEGVLGSNLFPVDPENDNDMLGIYMAASRFNHSCSSNASYSGVGCLLRVFSERNIKKGEEVCVSYLSSDEDVLYRDARARTAWLLQSKGFECKCEACSAPPCDRVKDDAERRHIWKMFEDMRLCGPERVLQLADALLLALPGSKVDTFMNRFTAVYAKFQANMMLFQADMISRYLHRASECTDQMIKYVDIMQGPESDRGRRMRKYKNEPEVWLDGV